jgi:hypothetical protein
MLNLFFYHLFRSIASGVEARLFVVLAVFFWFVPRFTDSVFAVFEEAGARLARKKHTALLFVASSVIILRVCALPLIPVPIPQVHDEFSYLLAGDTFVHGRLTNPPHPMWRFFDTIYVNQHPTYMSKYPPAQGAVLGLGQKLGNPWIGVLLSCAVMGAAVLWALQGWLPPEWAFLGAVIFVCRVGLFSYWIDSYWGGAAAATGGALVFGAFPRILRCWRPCDSILLGLGIAILANSRPFEGLIFCIPVVLGLIFAIWRKRTAIWPRVVSQLLVPLCAVGVFCAAFMIYYNLRGTGQPLVFPYTVNNRTYLTTPIFTWQTAREPFPHGNPQLDDFFNRDLRQSWFEGRVNTFRTLVKEAVIDVAILGHFYLGSGLCFIAPALLLLLREKKFRFVLVELSLCSAGLLLVPWFQPHYIAPLAATLFAAITQGLRHIRHWTWQGRPVGIGLSRVVVLIVVLIGPSLRALYPQPSRRVRDRDRISKQLRVAPGDHLVIVRYSEAHNVGDEWVYNEADIDHSRIVWAREIPGVERGPLLTYFHERHVWLMEPDLSPPRLTPCSN